MENPEQHQIKVRSAVDSDQEEICRIYSQHFGHTDPTVRHWWNILNNENIHYVVAEKNKVIVGVATLITINKVIRSGNRMGLIEDVAVEKDEGKQGIGKMLIDFLKKIAIEKSCYKIILNCDEDTVGFYKKCGFYQKEVQMRWDRPAKE